MKFSRLLFNGFIIFIGIALYFLLIETLGLADQIYLRLVNFVFVFYGVNRTIKANAEEGKQGYLTNLLAGFITAMFGLVLGLIAFMIYVEYKGGKGIRINNDMIDIDEMVFVLNRGFIQLMRY